LLRKKENGIDVSYLAVVPNLMQGVKGKGNKLASNP
jgi:hypothetical protein